ncbi:endonuclease-reverse transcriptase [Elysia marginata]|uniref:Endonuclease-reverse transcriptase n=1 Tax=Elysia marginata TaxID=1093978 RepID=A0AAV4HNV5_9GAST|nr:endonuclease-reverse transcriptase [Elysia marginata]
MIFRKAELKHGLNVDGETLTNLRFADDVALVTEDTKSMEQQLNNLNKISLESGLKMHEGAGHFARLQDNRWTLRVTEWQPRNGKRSRGRQARRWRDDNVRTMGNTWTREAKDREEWRRDAEGFILQWMEGA